MTRNWRYEALSLYVTGNELAFRGMLIKAIEFNIIVLE